MEARLAASDGIQEFLDNIADLKTCNQTEKYLTDLETKLQDVVNASVKVELTSGTLLTSAQMLLRLGLPLVILVGKMCIRDRAAKRCIMAIVSSSNANVSGNTFCCSCCICINESNSSTLLSK